jgi:protein TonB
MMAVKRRDYSPGFDMGLLAGLITVNLLFQFVPAAGLGRLSVRTTDEIMEAVDTFLPFDSSVDEQQQEVERQQENLENQIEEVIRDISPDVTMNLGTDTLGLSTVGTVETGLTGLPDGPEDAGPPRFMPVEVFPVCNYMPAPDYPEMARMAGIEGTVTLWVYVNASGVVELVRLYNSSGVGSLDEAAEAAAWSTRWTPAKNNGTSTAVWTTLQYRFQLQ